MQIDVKVVPRACCTEACPKLYQYTAIDEFTRLRYLAAYDEHSTYSSADFLRKVVAYFRSNKIVMECVQTDNSPHTPFAGQKIIRYTGKEKEGTPWGQEEERA